MHPLTPRRPYSRFVSASRAAALAATLCLALAAVGCTLSSLRAGVSIDEARQRLGPPAVEHATSGGGRRLLYPMGLQTQALEFDPQGRLQRSENVLDEAHFARVVPGITRERLLEQLGPPTRVWGVRLRNQTVWSYSFDDPFCREFQVGLTPAGTVDDTSYGPDPRCERPRFLPF